MQFPTVVHDAGKLAVEFVLDAHASRFELVFEERERILNNLVEIHDLELTAASAREVQQAIDDLGSTEGLLRDLLENG